MSILPAVTAALREIDRELPIAEAKSVEDIARLVLAERTMANWLFQVFAMLALGMAVFGVYGLLSYVVEQRHREFGIRSALGATRRDILWLVLRHTVWQASVGSVAGLLLVPLAGRPLASFLYGVTLADPIPWVIAPLLLITAAVAASLIPAISAVRAETAVALRSE
jgi:ABC-type antimicrobial peptide transport system permease subunit